MNPATNDWASSDPTQNITWAEADQFKNELAAVLAVEFADRFVKTQSGETIDETELRRNPFPAAPMNLWGTLAGPGGVPMNVAQLRAGIRTAAKSTNPAGELEDLLHRAFPKADVPGIILKFPVVARCVGTALAQIR